MLSGLSRDDRLSFLKFLCAFAWTDLEVTDTERRFVLRLCERANLADDEKRQVEEWLTMAPSPGSVDPKNVPREHRQLFLDGARAMVYADGNVDPDERATLDRLRVALDSE
jgi:uncharacterized tellurite resistance protein B-like protein